MLAIVSIALGIAVGFGIGICCMWIRNRVAEQWGWGAANEPRAADFDSNGYEGDGYEQIEMRMDAYSIGYECTEALGLNTIDSQIDYDYYGQELCLEAVPNEYI